MLGALLAGRAGGWTEPLGLARVGSHGTGFLLLLDQAQPQSRCRGGAGSFLFLQLVVVSPGYLQVGTHLAAPMAQWQYLWVASMKGVRIWLSFLSAGILFFRNSREYSLDESTRAKRGA